MINFTLYCNWQILPCGFWSGPWCTGQAVWREQGKSTHCEGTQDTCSSERKCWFTLKQPTLCLCLSVHLFASFFFFNCLSLSLSLCLSLSLSLSLSLPLSLSCSHCLSFSLCLSLSLSLSFSVALPTCLSVSLSICRSLFLSPPVFLSQFLSRGLGCCSTNILPMGRSYSCEFLFWSKRDKDFGLMAMGGVLVWWQIQCYFYLR